MNLIIVESPTKAKSINHYLGKGFQVLATYGHIRDLPQRKLGVDETTFDIHYVIPKKSKNAISELKKAAKEADKVYLATDADREGEAIAWHTAQILDVDINQNNRLRFYEVTKSAIEEAIKNPSAIDMKLVDAQQARRVLDRLVGYKLSPILWKKIRKGLSAGRVQSVALRIIVDREREIKDFKSEDYFLVYGTFLANDKQELKSLLVEWAGEKVKKMDIKTKQSAGEMVAKITGKPAIIKSVDESISKRSPAPPFITSSLQQEASSVLGYSPKKTMVIAQQLYEGIDLGGTQTGLITYMRTDSFHLGNSAVDQIRSYIQANWPADLNEEVRVFSKKVKMSQEAHEAIRPTDISRVPESIKEHLSKDQFRLYDLIWRRAVSTQMKDANLEITKISISVGDGVFEVKGEVMVYPGFTKVYTMKGKTKNELQLKKLPSVGEQLGVKGYEVEQKSTEPPARFTAASLIKELEDNGIGRPSTYAPTISTLTDRGYIQIQEKKLVPSEIAFFVIDLLGQNFPFVLDVDFTREMEEDLDAIASGDKEWKPIIKDFYGPFIKDVNEKSETIAKVELPVRKTDEKCPKCGSEMVIKLGRFGEFMACTRFPDCKGTKSVSKHLGVKCPKDAGELIERKTHKGRTFFGCENYPKCDFASWKKPTNEKCPTCGSMLLEANKNEYTCMDNKHVIKK